jgi:hypothetical protein
MKSNYQEFEMAAIQIFRESRIIAGSRLSELTGEKKYASCPLIFRANQESPYQINASNDGEV